MGQLGLSDTAQRILAAIELQADTPLAAVARNCRCRESTVRTTLERFKQSGLLLTRRSYINPYLYGYTNYAIYLALAVGTQKENKKLQSFLAAESGITWLAELGGEYQLAFSLSAEHISEVSEFIERLIVTFPGSIIAKDISVRSGIWTFPRKYLKGASKKGPVFLQGGLPRSALDEVDYQILKAISVSGFDSFRQLAERAGIPASTFSRRLQQLKEKRVIQGHYYILDVSTLQRQEYRLLLSVRGSRPKLPVRLLAFAEQHQNIRKFIRCLGSWDYELELDVSSGREAANVVAELCSTFADEIGRVRTLSLLAELSCSPFPAG